MSAPAKKSPHTTEAPWVRWTLIGVALTFMFLFLVLPWPPCSPRPCARAGTPTGKR